MEAADTDTAIRLHNDAFCNMGDSAAHFGTVRLHSSAAWSLLQH